jgi:predicted  nucleic acid-binding Zn-ribbon protein
MEDRIAKIEQKLENIFKMASLTSDILSKFKEDVNTKFKHHEAIISDRLEKLESFQFWMEYLNDADKINELNNYFKQINENVNVLNERQIVLGNSLVEINEQIEELKSSKTEIENNSVNSWEDLVNRLKK